MEPELVEIYPEWHMAWANKPTVNVVVDTEMPKWDDWIWTPMSKDRRNVTLISVNLKPWVRFVHINDPEGAPNLHGALSGEYHLPDGEIFKSTSGWSSRASAINSRYKAFLNKEGLGDIVEVTVKTPNDHNWAGFSLPVKFLLDHPQWPGTFYLIRDPEDAVERHYCPSTELNFIAKPKA